MHLIKAGNIINLKVMEMKEKCSLHLALVQQPVKRCRHTSQSLSSKQLLPTPEVKALPTSEQSPVPLLAQHMSLPFSFTYEKKRA